LSTNLIADYGHEDLSIWPQLMEIGAFSSASSHAHGVTLLEGEACSPSEAHEPNMVQGEALLAICERNRSSYLGVFDNWRSFCYDFLNIPFPETLRGRGDIP